MDEFFYGCLRFRGSARAMDVAKIIQDQRLQFGLGDLGICGTFVCLIKHGLGFSVIFYGLYQGKSLLNTNLGEDVWNFFQASNSKSKRTIVDG